MTTKADDQTRVEPRSLGTAPLGSTAASNPMASASGENDGEIDTSNRFLVGVGSGRVVILRLRADLSRADALNLAAYLVGLADIYDEFPALLQAVRNT